LGAKILKLFRCIDNLKGVTSAKILRGTIYFKEEGSEYIYNAKDRLAISTNKTGCLFCGQIENTFKFKGITVCRDCVENMNKN